MKKWFNRLYLRATDFLWTNFTWFVFAGIVLLIVCVVMWIDSMYREEQNKYDQNMMVAKSRCQQAGYPQMFPVHLTTNPDLIEQAFLCVDQEGLLHIMPKKAP